MKISVAHATYANTWDATVEMIMGVTEANVTVNLYYQPWSYHNY